MRPLGRLFFPDYIQEADDSESFGFSIQYQAGKDQSIREHSDASALTFNINIDLSNGFSGSLLYFRNPETGEKNYQRMTLNPYKSYTTADERWMKPPLRTEPVEKTWSPF